MGDNADVAVVAANIATIVAANTEPYVFLSYLLQILLEFIVLLFEVDAIGLFCLDAIYSSTLLISMFRLPVVSLVMIYRCLFKLNHMIICLYF
jgi:hypothetical protein